MTKPAFCKKHDVQSFILTSPRFAEAVERRENLSVDEVLTLRIHSYGKIYEYKIDDTFMEEFSLSPADGAVILYDREKTKKKLNDRLLIQKITRAMKYVCPVCLSEVFKNR